MRVVINKFNQALKRRKPWQISLLTLLLLAGVGALDYATGFEISFSIFYIVPIVIGAWYAPGRTIILLPLVAAGIWYYADTTSGHLYSETWIPLWNTSVRFFIFVMIYSLVRELRTHLKLEYTMARTDALTGLLNRRAFMQEADFVFKNTQRQRTPITVAFIDLDNFKAINDSKGHEEGDKVLSCVADLLVKSARSSDIAVRLGGDEFAVVLPQMNAENAAPYFKQLHQKLSKAMRDQGWTVGFSIGVAIFPQGAASTQYALTRADALMYRIKKKGKNEVGIEVFSAPEPRGSTKKSSS